MALGMDTALAIDEDASPEALLEARSTGTEIIEAFHRRQSCWWAVGAAMEKFELTAREAIESMQVAGHLPSLSPRTLQRMQKTYRRLREAGIEKEDVWGCPRNYAKTCVAHYEDGRISETELRRLLEFRTRHVGSAKALLEKVKDRPGDLANRLSASVRRG